MSNSFFYALCKKITFTRIRYIINGISALLLHKLFKPRTATWVWGSGSGYYENNVKIFLEYCLNKESQVIHLFETHRENVDTPVSLLKKGSLKAYIVAFNADVLVFDSGYSDIAPGFIQFARGLKVNLNHGQEGFKKLSSDYYKKIDADIHCAVSDFERDIKIKECGAPESTVYVTGQARYDKVTSNKSRDLNILLFFTWRDGLQKQSEKELRSGFYFQKIEEILLSKEVCRILEEADVNLYFRIHPMILPFKIDSGSSKIIQVGKQHDFSSLINNCQILITDYSSVAWDFMYNGRRVIFYPFDYDAYAQEPGLYLNMKTDLESDVVRSRKELEMALKKLVSNAQSANENSTLDKKYFQFRDQGNCERIHTLIMEKLGKR